MGLKPLYEGNGDDLKMTIRKFQTNMLIGSGIGIIFMVIGSFLSFIGYQQLKNAHDSLKWSITNGIILSSEIEKHEDSEHSTNYEAYVRYEYNVGGKHYLSNQVSFGQYGSNDPEHARSIVRQYEKGEKISVHFNPSNPNESILEPGVSFGTFIPLGLGFGFLGIGTFVAVTSWLIDPKQRQRRVESLRQAASTLGLTFLEEGMMLEGEAFWEFPLFRRGSSREISNILYKDIASERIFLFDYEFQQGSGENVRLYSQTVAAFYYFSRRMPKFSLKPKNINIFDKIREFFGQQDIDFETYPEFSRCYRLQGQLESAIREIFDFNVLRFFSQNHGWWLEGGGEWLVIYRLKSQIKPEEICTFLEQTAQISQLFV